MKGLFSGFSFLKNLMGSGGGKAAINAARSPFAARHAMGAMKAQAVLAGFSLLAPGSPQEKLQGLAINAGAAFLVMGMNSPTRQILWSVGIGMAPAFGSMMRGVLHGYRGALESRTSAHIPFSHSTIAMDQAYSTLQYSKQRMNDAYSNVGNEAAFFAARFMAR